MMALRRCANQGTAKWCQYRVVLARSFASQSTLAGDGVVRHDWTREEVRDIYKMPLLELVFRAASVHRMHFNPREVQQSTLLSIKTGGCPEDCGYCSQSQHFKTMVKPTKLEPIEEVLAKAREAKAAGSTRFCMGAAWRGVGQKRAFKDVLKMVREVSGLGLETCCTLGTIDAEQAVQLKEAGLTAYNHNLDTSPEHYKNIVSTRTYTERLETLANVREAGISVCCGGILGIAETEDDRIGLLTTLANLPEHPESVPINALVPVPGTPLGDRQIKEGKVVQWHDMVRAIAAAKIVMPTSSVRLSAGRMEFSQEAQGLMFLAGANSIFTGDKLLTTANPDFAADMKMFEVLGLKGKAPFTGNTAAFRPAWATEETIEPSESSSEPLTSVGLPDFPAHTGEEPSRPRAVVF